MTFLEFMSFYVIIPTYFFGSKILPANWSFLTDSNQKITNNKSVENVDK